MNNGNSGVTALIVVQSILSIIVVVTFAFQEVTMHSVDTDLKLITFGVIGFWLGGIATSGIQRLQKGNGSNV